MKTPLISVIMPAYNAEKYISDSIDSVLNQSIQNFELIIIDDNSQDNTTNIINKYNDPRIVLIINSNNLGVSETRNIGISAANGKYIAFLDSDDIWLPHKLSLQIMCLNDGWDVVSSNYIAFESNADNKITERKSPSIISYSDMLKSNFIGNLTGIYNVQKIGKIYQKKSGHEDYIMWLEIIKKSKKAYCIQESLAKYRLHNSSLSSNKVKAIKWQWSIYRNELKLSLPKSIYYFSHYIINALKKRR
ncbi:glycosyltransferase family 2 protein [Morganella morganii]|uniref:glycosyltransferase family 2 protein n=1 Tax=Morganella morganii TaxID=582 RepID=UPI00339BB103|nr:UDP-Glc:alpha-D-GlcNAc-diphosphoundecaprenol beta-1,3-glucosyltransferase WfgD [Morganella morganii]